MRDERKDRNRKRYIKGEKERVTVKDGWREKGEKQKEKNRDGDRERERERERERARVCM